MWYTYPAAGVIATNPTTVPIQAPIAYDQEFYLKYPSYCRQLQ
jgi:hypothetical protein